MFHLCCRMYVASKCFMLQVFGRARWVMGTWPRHLGWGVIVLGWLRMQGARGQGEGAGHGEGWGQGVHARWARQTGAGCVTIHIQTWGAAGLSNSKCICIYLPSCRIFFFILCNFTIVLSLKGFSCMPIFKLCKLIQNHLLVKKKKEWKKVIGSPSHINPADLFFSFFIFIKNSIWLISSTGSCYTRASPSCRVVHLTESHGPMGRWA
jgi:hypothetical protein